MINLPGVMAAAEEIQTFCQTNHWPFCFIGGVAVQRWGEPRLTQDVDLTLLTGLGNEKKFIDILLSEYSGRRPDARDFALTYRVLLLRTASKVDIDLALGALPFEERSVERATFWPWTQGRAIKTCSAEDLVVHKTFAGRDLDWGDVERILIRQHGKLNLAQVRSELKPLLELKGENEALEKLQRRIATIESRLGANPEKRHPMA